MLHALSIPVGVVVAREKIDHPWQEYRWRTISVFLDAPEDATWRELRHGPGFVQYHAATLPLELHRKETEAYLLNLEGGEPSVYVVLRLDEDQSQDARPAVHLVSASPYEVQAYGESGQDAIDRVPMPERLVEVLQDFVATHHREEKFVKRQRQQHFADDEHKFGQEPLVVLRQRMHAAGRDGGGHE